MIKRIVWFLVMLAVVLAAALTLLRNRLAGAALVRGIRQETGLEARIGRVEIGVLRPLVRLEKFRLLNPAGFDRPDVLQVDLLAVEYDRASLWRGSEIRLKRLELEVPELAMERDAQGRTNIEKLGETVQAARKERAGPPPATPSAGTPGETSAPPPAETPRAAARPARTLRIDRLRVKVGAVVVRDESKKPAVVRRYPLGQDMEFENVTDFRDVLQQIAAQVAVQAAPQLLQEMAEAMNRPDGMKDMERQAREMKKALRQLMKKTPEKSPESPSSPPESSALNPEP